MVRILPMLRFFECPGMTGRGGEGEVGPRGLPHPRRREPLRPPSSALRESFGAQAPAGRGEMVPDGAATSLLRSRESFGARAPAGRGEGARKPPRVAGWITPVAGITGGAGGQTTDRVGAAPLAR